MIPYGDSVQYWAVVNLMRNLGAEEIVVGEGSAFRRDLGSAAKNRD